MNARKTPPLSRMMSNGQLALLDPGFLQRYFSLRIPRWYPGEKLLRIAVTDQSHALYKKSILYTLTLRAPRGKKERSIALRGNVPSLDTTREALNAYTALMALWEHAPALRTSITRPIAYDPSLRVLLYESAPGKPLMSLLRHRKAQRMAWLARAADWLALLHRYTIPAGQIRTLRDERREAGYFLMNYRGFFPACVPRAEQYISAFFKFRAKLSRRARRATLIHGDYNPNNIIVDTNPARLSVIDFGNARQYEPMSDLANSLIQLGYVNIRPASHTWRLQKSFLSSYERRRPLTRVDRAWLALFRMWWSMQTLSFTMTLPMTTRANIQPVIARTFREAEQSIRFLTDNS